MSDKQLSEQEQNQLKLLEATQEELDNLKLQNRLRDDSIFRSLSIIKLSEISVHLRKIADIMDRKKITGSA